MMELSTKQSGHMRARQQPRRIKHLPPLQPWDPRQNYRIPSPAFCQSQAMTALSLGQVNRLAFRQLKVVPGAEWVRRYTASPIRQAACGAVAKRTRRAALKLCLAAMFFEDELGDLHSTQIRHLHHAEVAGPDSPRALGHCSTSSPPIAQGRGGLGGTPGLWMAGEHGQGGFRRSGRGTWTELSGPCNSGSAAVRGSLDRAGLLR